MSEHLTTDAAAVFAVVNDPQYNALRLHLMGDEPQEVSFHMTGTGGEAAPGEGEHADVVRRTERA